MKTRCWASASVLMVISIVWCAAGCQQPANIAPTGPMDQHSVAVRRILELDGQLGSTRNRATESVPLTTSIREYVAAIDGLDFSSCPESFTEAFRRHRDAWNDSLPFFERFPEMRGEMHDLFDELRDDEGTQLQLEAIDKQIWDTWGEVEAAAEPHLPAQEADDA